MRGPIILLFITLFFPSLAQEWNSYKVDNHASVEDPGVVVARLAVLSMVSLLGLWLIFYIMILFKARNGVPPRWMIIIFGIARWGSFVVCGALTIVGSYMTIKQAYNGRPFDYYSAALVTVLATLSAAIAILRPPGTSKEVQ